MTIVKKNVSSEKVIGLAADRLASEVTSMRAKSDSAIGVFNATVKNLESINAELRVSADRARQFAAVAIERAEEAERKIAENNSVCQKIYEIIGQPVAAAA